MVNEIESSLVSLTYKSCYKIWKSILNCIDFKRDFKSLCYVAMPLNIYIYKLLLWTFRCTMYKPNIKLRRICTWKWHLRLNFMEWWQFPMSQKTRQPLWSDYYLDNITIHCDTGSSIWVVKLQQGILKFEAATQKWRKKWCE